MLKLLLWQVHDVSILFGIHIHSTPVGKTTENHYTDNGLFLLQKKRGEGWSNCTYCIIIAFLTLGAIVWSLAAILFRTFGFIAPNFKLFGFLIFLFWAYMTKVTREHYYIWYLWPFFVVIVVGQWFSPFCHPIKLTNTPILV